MKDRLNTILKNIPELARYLIAAATIFIISLLFPNYQQFNYAFEIGQQWKGRDLYAPFDFAVLKEQAEINQQLDSLKKTLVPCYERNVIVPNQQAVILTERFNKKLKTVSKNNLYKDVTTNAEQYLNTCKGILVKIYKKGIIEREVDFGNKTPTSEILIADENRRIKHAFAEFQSLEEAEADFTASLMNSGLKDSDFFLSIFQEKPNLIIPNIIFNDTLTNQFHASTLQNFTRGRGMVKEGERIISRREMINDNTYQKLLSLKDTYNKKELQDTGILWIRMGYFVLSSLVILLFIFFLKHHITTIYSSYKQLLFMMMWIVVFTYLAYWIETTDLVSIYIVPFSIVPIVIKNFYDDIIALFTHIAVVLMVSLLSSLGFEFVFMQILVGVVVIIANVKTRYWSNFFFSMIYIFLTYLVIFVGLSMIHQSTWDIDNPEIMGWLFGNVFLTLLSYSLVPLLERLFGFTSDITLDELSNLDQPLLKELSMKTPGTLQHSLQVGHLSEAAATEIGANALLVKVAALYHDIGKIKNPRFFIENQQREGNPHDDISPTESAAVIIGHVTQGLKMAKKAGLPKVVLEFIATHHGTTRVEYFYRKALEANSDKEIDENNFRYPGPKPTSKEHVIMMLADSIEAASKSIQSPTEENLENLIEKIIAGKIANEQLVNAKITFEELDKIKNVFKRVLKSINHARIAYPDDKK
jgi:putative nucleotidyltransferase with HDIG domain